jgi:hypothetical protein
VFSVHLPLIGVKNLLLPDIADSAVLHRWVASSLTLLAMTRTTRTCRKIRAKRSNFFSV